MSNLILVKVSKEYKNQIEDMLVEWKKFNNEHPDTYKSPAAIFYEYSNFDDYIHNLIEIGENYDKYDSTKVPATTYFALDKERNIMVGAVNIRHYLNDYLRQFGGHIGDGVRPSERRKGFATEIISLALQKCKELGIDQVMITCNENNIGSKKSIIKNGGVYQKTTTCGDERLEIYLIDNK